MKNGQYCFEQQINKKRIYTPLNPQPSYQKVLIIQRYYSTLKASQSYKKRVTWVEQSAAPYEPLSKRAVVEYCGSFPGLQPHGHAKTAADYVRMPATTMDLIGQKVKTQKPLTVYNELLLANDIIDAPRNPQQIRSKKYHDKKKTSPTLTTSTNFADQMQQVIKMTETCETIQQVIYNKGSIPSVIMFSDDQITDIKRFCCTGQSVLSVDKTFNLGEIFVTASNYKQLSVISCTSNDHPFFPGPLFLHGHSTFESYQPFFSKIAAQLADTDTSKLVIGTDDEQAMRKAIKVSLPNSHNILCTRHLKNNVDDHLRDKVGVSKPDRQIIMSDIFGDNGLINADDTFIYEQRTHILLEKLSVTCPDFLPYFNKRVIPLLKDGVVDVVRKTAVSSSWTNNNAESLNHVFKQLIDWKPQPLPVLCNLLSNHILAQFKDLERAMVGMGKFRLHAGFEHFKIQLNIWAGKSLAQRKKMYSKFIKFNSKNTGKVTSTDNQLTIPKTPSAGKKPHQSKRKINARTTTIKRIKLNM